MAAVDLTKILASCCSSNTVKRESPADSVDVMSRTSEAIEASSWPLGVADGVAVTCWPSSAEMPDRLRRKGSLHLPGLKCVGADACVS